MGFNVDQARGPEEVVGLVISTVLGFLGIIFVVLMVYGGVLWMTAGGNDQEVEKAQKIIKRTAIGLFLVVISYGLSWFIISIIS